MEAGCKRKTWEYQGNVAIKYNWVATGKLLAIGVCIKDGYKKYFPPEYGTTKVYSTINNPEIRQVDAKKKTISLDFTLKMRWLDARIKTNLSHGENKVGEITLGPKAIEEIWFPDLYILNRQSFKIKEEWAALITTRILTGVGNKYMKAIAIM